jgi:hypothetical protein
MLILIILIASSSLALEWNIVKTSGTGDKCPSANQKDIVFGNKGTFFKDYAMITFGDNDLMQVSLCGNSGTAEAIIESEAFSYDSDNDINFKGSFPIVSGLQVYMSVDGRFEKQINSPTWWKSPSDMECYKDLKTKQNSRDPYSDDPIYSSYSYSGAQWGDGKKHKIRIRVVKGDEIDCFNVVHLKDFSINSVRNPLGDIPSLKPENGDASLNILEWLKDFFFEDDNTIIPNEIKLEQELLKIGQVLDKRYYVLNPFVDDDPFVIFGSLASLFLKFNDYTFNALITGKEGITCGDYVDKTRNEVKNLVTDLYGSRAKLEEVYMMEHSTVSNDGWFDSFKSFMTRTDALFDVNHVCYRITYPDGKQEYIDFWSYQMGDPLIGPWEEKEAYWVKAISGSNSDEFRLESDILIKQE